MYLLTLITVCVFLSNSFVHAKSDLVAVLADTFSKQQATPLWYDDPLKATKELKKSIAVNVPKSNSIIETGSLLANLYNYAEDREAVKAIPSLCTHHFTGQGPIKLSSTKKMNESEKKVYLKSLTLIGENLNESMFLKQKDMFNSALHQNNLNKIQSDHILYSYLFVKLSYMGFDKWCNFEKDVRQDFKESTMLLKNVLRLTLRYLDEIIDTTFSFERAFDLNLINTIEEKLHAYTLEDFFKDTENKEKLFYCLNDHLNKLILSVPVLRIKNTYLEGSDLSNNDAENTEGSLSLSPSVTSSDGSQESSSSCYSDDSLSKDTLSSDDAFEESCDYSEAFEDVAYEDSANTYTVRYVEPLVKKRDGIEVNVSEYVVRYARENLKHVNEKDYPRQLKEDEYVFLAKCLE